MNLSFETASHEKIIYIPQLWNPDNPNIYLATNTRLRKFESHGLPLQGLIKFFKLPSHQQPPFWI